MSQTALSYGLIPLYHWSGQNRGTKYVILNTAGVGYASSIYKGDLVKIGTNGTIEISDGTSPNLGVFMGCEYIDPTGKPNESPYWPASTAVKANTEIVAYVIDDQSTTFRVGVTANASNFVQAVVGQQVDVANVGTGTASTGLSLASVAVAPAAAGVLANLRIVGFYDGIYDAVNNPFPQLLVQLAEVQFAPNAVGI